MKKQISQEAAPLLCAMASSIAAGLASDHNHTTDARDIALRAVDIAHNIIGIVEEMIPAESDVTPSN